MVTASVPALIPQLQILSDQISELVTKSTELKAAINHEQAQWSPDKNRWSILECVEHLNIVGELALPSIRNCIDKLHTKDIRSSGPFTYNFVERYFIKFVSPNTPMSMPVPPPYNPKIASADPDKIWERFFDLQKNLQKCIQDANGFNLKKVSFSSPISPITRFSLGAWMEGLVAHERYHWGQIEALQLKMEAELGLHFDALRSEGVAR